MSNKVHITYFLFISLACALVIMAIYFSPVPPEDTTIDVIEPVETIELGEYEREFIFDVSEVDTYKKDIVFFAKHQYIRIYANDELIYEYTENAGIWGRTTGAVWNFMDIPHEASEFRVYFSAAYDEVKNDVPVFYLGDKLVIFQYIYRNSIPTVLASILIMLVGIVLIIYWVFLKNRFDVGKSMLYLGMLSFLFGVYSLNETNAAIIGLRHHAGLVFMTYLLVMSLSTTAILFIKEFIGTIENVMWKLLCIANAVEFVVCVALQFLNILDLRETLVLSHILICVTGVYIFVNLLVKMYRQEYSTMLRASLIGVGVLVLSIVFNLAVYYSNTSSADTNVIGRIGFLIFIVILGRESARYSLELMEKGRKAEIYEELAIKDMLTGLRNRNAYITDIEALKAYNDILIITFDLNDLKRCNDTKGHAEGDNYILSAANIIKKSFSTYGTCYRIGGDEFCVIIKKASTCPLEELIKSLEDEQNKFNMANPSFDMNIAYGYAVFDSTKDGDIEQTRDRADSLMYKHKRKIKQKAQA